MASPKHQLMRSSIPDALVNEIRERILNGDFAEGAQIRQEVIAEEYSVSRMPVRDALRRLEAEGLIVLHANKGASVSVLSLEEIKEIFDLRTMLEVDVLRNSLPLMTTEQFAHCEQVLQKLEEAYRVGDAKLWGALNMEFHASLYEAAARPQSKIFIQNLNYQADRYIRLYLVLTDGLKRAEREHRDLFEACKAGDIYTATTVLKDHIQAAKTGLLAAVKDSRAQ